MKIISEPDVARERNGRPPSDRVGCRLMMADKCALQWLAISPEVSLDRPSKKFKLGASPKSIHGYELTEKNIMNSRCLLPSAFCLLPSAFCLLPSADGGRGFCPAGGAFHRGKRI